MTDYRGKHARHANTDNGAAVDSGAPTRGFVPAAPRASSASRAGSGLYSQDDGTVAKKMGKGSNVWTIVFRVSLVALIIALIALAAIVFMYWQGRSSYEKLSETFAVTDIVPTSLADYTVDWEGLRERNSDIVGWIFVPGTKIDYPVVQTSDNNTYLSRTFDGDSGMITFGTIFLDTKHDSSFGDANNFMYGHNMNDGSMFSVVADWQDDDEFNAARTIFLFTPGGNYRFTTFALDHVSADKSIVQGTFDSHGAFVDYITDKLDRSIVTADPAVPDLNGVVKTIALSTCDNYSSDGRYIAFAYLAESTVPGVAGLEQIGDAE